MRFGHNKNYGGNGRFGCWSDIFFFLEVIIVLILRTDCLVLICRDVRACLRDEKKVVLVR